MNATEAIRELQRWVLGCGVPRKRLAVEAGLGGWTLRNVDKDDWNPVAETIRKLETYRARLCAHCPSQGASSGGDEPMAHSAQNAAAVCDDRHTAVVA